MNLTTYSTGIIKIELTNVEIQEQTASLSLLHNIRPSCGFSKNSDCWKSDRTLNALLDHGEEGFRALGPCPLKSQLIYDAHPLSSFNEERKTSSVVLVWKDHRAKKLSFSTYTK